MSDVLSGPVPVKNFYLFAEQTGPVPAPFDPNKPIKRWVAPLGFDFEAHGIKDYGEFLLFPLSVKTGIGGVSVDNPFVVPKSEVFKLNIPPEQKMPGVPTVPLNAPAPYRTPIDPLKFDSENYYVSAEGPLGGSIVVRDHRADAVLSTPFTVADQRRLAQIEDLLTRLAAKLGV